MTRLNILLLLSLFTVCSAIAQTDQKPGDEFVQQVNFNHNVVAHQTINDITSTFHMNLDTADLLEGQKGAAFVNQNGNDSPPIISQSGWGNVAFVNILGDRNRSGQQSENSNRFILNLEGSDGMVDEVQTENKNSFNMDLPRNTQNQIFSQTSSTLSLKHNEKGGY